MNIIELTQRSKPENKTIRVLFQDGDTGCYEYFEPVFVSPIKSSYIDNSDLLGYSFHNDKSEYFFFKTEVKCIEIKEVD